MIRHLGVIVARGTSKRLPRKNLKPLLGIPLVGWLIRAALASKLDRVVVTTEDTEIADYRASLRRAHGAVHAAGRTCGGLCALR